MHYLDYTLLHLYITIYIDNNLLLIDYQIDNFTQINLSYNYKPSPHNNINKITYLI